MQNNGLAYVLERLGERSTWLGIIAAVSAFGATLAPELSSLIVTAGVGVAGLVAVLVKDDGAKGFNLGERSTWVGLFAVLGSAGITISPELSATIIAVAVGGGATAAAVTKD